MILYNRYWPEEILAYSPGLLHLVSLFIEERGVRDSNQSTFTVHNAGSNNSASDERFRVSKLLNVLRIMQASHSFQSQTGQIK